MIQFHIIRFRYSSVINHSVQSLNDCSRTFMYTMFDKQRAIIIYIVIWWQTFGDNHDDRNEIIITIYGFSFWIEQHRVPECVRSAIDCRRNSVSMWRPKIEWFFFFFYDLAIYAKLSLMLSIVSVICVSKSVYVYYHWPILIYQVLFIYHHSDIACHMWSYNLIFFGFSLIFFCRVSFSPNQSKPS